MGGSGFEARARGTQPPLRRALVGPGTGAPFGTGSIFGSSFAERPRRDRLGEHGSGIGVGTLMRALERIAPGRTFLSGECPAGSVGGTRRKNQR